jgi:TonB family protein
MRSIPIPFLAALVAAIAVHAALLVGHGSNGTGGVAPSPRSLLLVRMLEARPDRVGEQAREGALSAPLRLPDPSLERSDRPSRTEPRASTAQIGAETRPIGNNRSGVSAASAAAAGGQRAQVTRPEGGLPPAPGYLFGVQLDARPSPLYDIEPVFPPEADLQEGVVTLRILISATGNVDNVAVVSASPPGLFERSALTAFESAKFSPGMTLGVAVKSQMTVEVNFTPFNRGAKASGRSY